MHIIVQTEQETNVTKLTDKVLGETGLSMKYNRHKLRMQFKSFSYTHSFTKCLVCAKIFQSFNYNQSNQKRKIKFLKTS